MFGKLVRLLVRLFFFALIAGVVGFVITRLMGGEDDDFEDFEDLESSFEFNETPVEIDVSGPATSEAGVDGSSGSAAESDSAPEYRVEAYANNATVALDESSADSSADSSDEASDDTSDETSDDTSDEDSAEAIEAGTEGPRLIDIKGIGPSYEARLRGIGITSMSDLLNADSEQVAEQINVIGGATEVDDWKVQARDMTSGDN